MKVEKDLKTKVVKRVIEAKIDFDSLKVHYQTGDLQKKILALLAQIGNEIIEGGVE